MKRIIASNITKRTALYKPGICKIFIIPLGVINEMVLDQYGVFPWPELLEYEDFDENGILSVSPVMDTVKISETPKDSKSGMFLENKISFETNDISILQLRSLNALQLKPVQVLAIYKNGNSRIFGTTDRGVDLTYSINESDESKASIQLTGQSQDPSPFTDFTL